MTLLHGARLSALACTLLTSGWVLADKVYSCTAAEGNLCSEFPDSEIDAQWQGDMCTKAKMKWAETPCPTKDANGRCDRISAGASKPNRSIFTYGSEMAQHAKQDCESGGTQKYTDLKSAAKTKQKKR
jgi:hypothetical protein